MFRLPSVERAILLRHLFHCRQNSTDRQEVAILLTLIDPMFYTVLQHFLDPYMLIALIYLLVFATKRLPSEYLMFHTGLGTCRVHICEWQLYRFVHPLTG